MDSLHLSDLGGSNKKHSKKHKKHSKKHKKHSKKHKKHKKGGELQADDIYKNSEGPQF